MLSKTLTIAVGWRPHVDSSLTLFAAKGRSARRGALSSTLLVVGDSGRFPSLAVISGIVSGSLGIVSGSSNRLLACLLVSGSLGSRGPFTYFST